MGVVEELRRCCEEPATDGASVRGFRGGDLREGRFLPWYRLAGEGRSPWGASRGASEEDLLADFFGGVEGSSGV